MRALPLSPLVDNHLIVAREDEPEPRPGKSSRGLICGVVAILVTAECRLHRGGPAVAGHG